MQRRTPALWVFGVDDDRVQLCWRALAPGRLTVRARTTDAEVEVEVDAPVGVVDLTGLPAGRLLTLEASGSALAAPQTLMARTLGRLGGSELCRVATLSDLHVGAHTFGHRGTIRDHSGHEIAHPQRCAAAAIDEAEAWGAQRLVVKGDLTNGALAHQWREYAAIVGRASVPVDAIPGNHDHAPDHDPTAILPRDAARAFGLSIADPLVVRDLPGLRLLLVDCTRPGRHRGTVAHCRADLLDAAASAPRDGGVLVVLHQQLEPHRVTEGWPPGIRQAESFALLDDLGRAHPHVLVTSGHTHRHRRWGRSGVVVTQVGSTKDYPGVWAGYRVFEGGIRQVVQRVGRPDCVAWTDHSRRAAFGLWEHAAPGRLDARCFNVAWSST